MRALPGRLWPLLLAFALTPAMGAPEGHYFSDFSCANLWPARLNRPDLWRALDLGMAREDATWGAVEPRRGVWQWKDRDARVLDLNNQGVPVLLLLGYTPPWTWVDHDYSFVESGHRWDVTVLPFDPAKGSRSARVKITDLATGKVTEADAGNLPPRNVKDWQRYVDRVVAHYSRPPFNVRYFQIWNEFNWPDWYHQTWHDFADRIYIPAAKIIHAHGCQVVFGGWACTQGAEDLCNFLKYHDLWRYTDIIDFHYQVDAAFQICYDQYIKTGKCRGIWQTETGFTAWQGYLTNCYARVFYWALTHDWRRRDQYKMFWFHFVGPSAKCLTDQFTPGQPVGEQGKCLRTLANLLPGRVRAWKGFTTDPRLPFTLTEEHGSSEGFATDASVVVAAHLPAAMLQKVGALVVRMPGLAAQALEVAAMNRQGDKLPVKLSRKGGDLTATVSLTGCKPETWRFKARGFTVLLRVLLRPA